MTTKTVLVVGLVAVSGYAITRGMLQHLAKRQASFETSALEGTSNELKELRTPATARSVPVERSFPPDLVAALRIEPRPARGQAPRRSPPSASASAVAQNFAPFGTGAPAPAPSTELADPVARVALSFVGADPEAEGYWIDAINDPSLSAHERQDLIEDLNEEGFLDPRHPTEDDLPLIVSRLQLIEELAPEAMDDVNSEAFAEAKKDLERMAERIQE